MNNKPQRVTSLFSSACDNVTMPVIPRTAETRSSTPFVPPVRLTFTSGRLVIPYLSEDPIFKRSREEAYRCFREFLDESEASAAADDECPNIEVTEWNGFQLAYAIDWSLGFSEMRSTGFFTKQMALLTGMTQKEGYLKDLDTLMWIK